MRPRNFLLAIQDQLPLSRLWRNLRKGHLWGLIHRNSHISQGSGKPKVMYNTKATAYMAGQSMAKKTGFYYSSYKCVFCNGYHIGRNRDIKNNWDQNDPTVHGGSDGSR